MQPKLTIELVPRTCWGSNVRKILTATQWRKISQTQAVRAGHVCEICGESGLTQGTNRTVECHEIWHYNDETHVQTLTGLISLCPNCHQVKHYGRTKTLAPWKAEAMHERLARLNGWSQDEVKRHVSQSWSLWEKRSLVPWSLDISLIA